MSDNDQTTLPANEQVNQFIRKALHVWGFMFRAFIIGVIGYIGSAYFDPQDLSDVAFSQITFNDLARNLGGLAIPIACVSWFFNFPEKTNSEYDPYIKWAEGSFYAVGIGLLIWIFVNYS